MNAAFSRMKKLFKKFNLREFNFEDFEKIARRERINIANYKMHANVRGYYTNELRKVYRKKCIVFNEGLSDIERLYIAFHELAHHYLHVTLENKQIYFCRLNELNEAKFDLEADAVAVVMMIPKKLLIELNETCFEELDLFTQDILIRRRWILKNHGV